MSDRVQVVDLAYAYGHAVDRRNAAAVAACFAVNGELEAQGGGVSITGRKALEDFYAASFVSPMLASGLSSHLMNNVLVEVGGTEARMQIEALIFLPSADLTTVLVRGVRYTDDVRRTDVGWRFARRRHELVWQAQMAGEPGDAAL